MARTPKAVGRFCKTVLPLIHKRTSGKRTLDDVRAVMETDRWNSFDRFHETTETLVRKYKEAGAEAEVYAMQTGGQMGSGRWIIHEAADVICATVDVVRPVRKRVLDYKKNPWHVIQWAGSTPRGGMENELVVVDSEEELDRIPASRLAGKMVLTCLEPRGLLRKLGEKGAVGVITDRPIPNLPDATAWAKFGWGGIPIDNASFHLVGLVLSENEGKKLRALLQKHGKLVLHTEVDIRKYVGTHDQVSGLIRGAGDPQDEVWVLAHSAEPGAIDNASGVAVCLEIARVLEGLIVAGDLPRPKRTIRLMNAYECHGFFKYLEDTRRLQTPLAGVVIDTIGSRPEVCDGRMEWHATIPMSAGFVDRLGASILRASLKLTNPGYTLYEEPFQPTSDTLIGDPKYGFPCPWLTTHHRKTGKGFDAYHTSADQPELLSSQGLAVCATGMAGYLYFLANAGTEEALQFAQAETERTISLLQGKGMSASRVMHERELHRVNVEKLQRWLWTGDRADVLAQLSECEMQVREASEQALGKRKPATKRHAAGANRIPHRKVLLSPISENVPGAISRRIGSAGLSSWALFWADGRRTLAEIAEAVSNETGKDVAVEKVVDYFEAHEELGYVELFGPEEVISKAQLTRELKALGVKAGMDVMVHSSLSAIGYVDGGADTVVDALLTTVGKRGTLVMPSFNHRGAHVYNRLTTPTTNGAIPDVFWRRPGVVRSDHPTHAVAAFGPRAEEICKDHRKNGVWTVDSPIGRLVHGGGYILLLGVDHNATTAYHVAELSVPCGCIDPLGYTDRVVNAEGEVEEVAGLAFRTKVCPISPSKLNVTLDRGKRQKKGPLGKGEATLVSAIEVWKARRAHLKNVCPTCTIQPRTKK
ncbi:MAG: AAC(3) family N-acetyltransferase [bacterium]|nr:AAC(3) family N-acetyltransferase [bacterium]